MPTRRTFLTASATAAAPLLLPDAVVAAARRRARPPRAAGGAFPLGVWAGQPAQRGMTLGTKVAGLESTRALHLEVAADPGFARVVHAQDVAASTVRDHAVKTRVLTRALRPGERYWYRFATRTTSSPVGRFTTARPADSQEPLRIGFFSCQQFQDGFYTAHRGLAEEEDLDLVVCLGDYIYEKNGRSDLPGRTDATVEHDTGECETLDEYRRKYALYKSDPDLQAMHAAHAVACTWDDHEVENDRNRFGGDTQARRRIPFEERRRNATLAYFEHLPVERVRSDGGRVFRRLRLGGMVDLFLLDLRTYRDVQGCNGRQGLPCAANDDPGRTILGAPQKAWLQRGLEGSTAAWKVLGSSVQMMGLHSAPTLDLNPDGWDGYGAERAEVLERAHAKGVRDISVITGDVHFFAAGEVTPSGDLTTPARATEFIGGSISSEFVNEYGLVSTGLLTTNPHIKDADLNSRGYGVLEASAKELRVSFRSPVTTKARTSAIRTIGHYVVPRGTPRVERA